MKLSPLPFGLKIQMCFLYTVDEFFDRTGIVFPLEIQRSDAAEKILRGS
jgi:hypothetical protein